MTALPATEFDDETPESLRHNAATAELSPVGRFEWERIIRRVKMPASTKHLALTLATYADSDGSRIWPGNERLARVMCVSTSTVERGLKRLRSRGFLQRTKQGNKYAHQADEHRLTVPSTLLEFDLLPPDEGPSLAVTHDG
ncbi:helix-turn-helix domain-containing protein [Rhodococcus sp. NPDC127530]|uniref:helix-turn-helix domain-containing protein n=1 Tax=unclassified Rhodococcus (in: high G+C Gram-positive bacteria) TaxID=192944 RepID=UPI0036326779